MICKLRTVSRSGLFGTRDFVLIVVHRSLFVFRTTADFCTGKAHRGLSEMATNIWKVSGKIIDKIFSQLEIGNDCPQWKFVITGHSLGAGVGTLLNIKCHVEGLLGQRQVRCYGFASPPVFNIDDRIRDTATASAIGKAIKNSTGYINGDDCVPFLSEVSVSRLSTQIKTVDDACKHLWRRDRAALASGRMPIPQVLIHAVTRVDQPDVPGSTTLTIPAGKVVWMKEDHSAVGFSAFGCRSKDLVNLNVFVSAKLISDHMPSAYEESLEALASY